MTCSKGGVFRDILVDVVFTDKSIGTSTDEVSINRVFWRCYVLPDIV